MLSLFLKLGIKCEIQILLLSPYFCHYLFILFQLDIYFSSTKPMLEKDGIATDDNGV